MMMIDKEQKKKRKIKKEIEEIRKMTEEIQKTDYYLMGNDIFNEMVKYVTERIQKEVDGER